MGAGDNFIYTAITAENPEDPHPFGRRECGTSRGASRRICPDLFFLGSFLFTPGLPWDSSPSGEYVELLPLSVGARIIAFFAGDS